MVVLAIGLLGMAAMTVLVMRGNRSASNLTAATNICQTKIEELKDVDWDLLGNWTVANTSDEQAIFGMSGGQMVQETELNGEGKSRGDVCTELSTGTDPCVAVAGSCDTDGGVSDTGCKTATDARGPYRFVRTFVICRGDQYDTSTAPATPSTDPVQSNLQPPATDNCATNPSNNTTRTQWLNCLPQDITSTTSANREKKMKVLCAWRSSEGDCHSVHLDTTVVKLQ